MKIECQQMMIIFYSSLFMEIQKLRAQQKLMFSKNEYQRHCVCTYCLLDLFE